MATSRNFAAVRDLDLVRGKPAKEFVGAASNRDAAGASRDDPDALRWQFGARNIRVGALRAHAMFRNSSHRLLADMVDVLPRNGEGLVRDEVMVNHARVSPCLFRSLNLPNTGAYMRFREQQRRSTHLVWLCQAANSKVRLEALAQVLAAGISEQFDEDVAVVTFRGMGALVERCGVRGFEPMGRFHSLAALRRKLPQLQHLLFVGSLHPHTLPTGFQELSGQMDRVVYVTQQRPQRAPRTLVRLLRAELRRRVRHIDAASATVELEERDSVHGPFFSSFVATVVGEGVTEPFRTEPIDEDYQTPRTRKNARPGWRTGRDLCRLRFELDRIDELWDAYRHGSRCESFPTLLFAESEAAKQSAWRWARAVTNRSVGVALSGGGASSYRFVPLLRRLYDGNVPVDVVAGVSGGALVGAYYCTQGPTRSQRCLDSGWRVQLGAVGAMFSAAAFRWMLDRDLGDARVEDSEVRFAPVTTVLQGERPVSAHVVVAGSMGEAVEVSGAAPVIFAPSVQWSWANGPGGSWWNEAATAWRVGIRRFLQQRITRYSDGGTAMLIPARILRDCGADYVFAFNCLAGPKQTNPLAALPGGDLLYHATPLGRLADLLVSAAYLQQQLSRQAAADADVFFEPREVVIPFFEGFQFARAESIAESANESQEIHECVERCREVWDEFRTPCNWAN